MEVAKMGSLSGRLRSVSDLEKSGLVTSSEKGRLKDLIISGDEALRTALDKFVWDKCSLFLGGGFKVEDLVQC